MLFNKKGEIPKWINLITAIIVLAGGALPLLSTFGIIGEIPGIPIIVIQIITVVAGILLLLDGFIGSGMGSFQMPRSINFIVAIIALVGGIIPLLANLGVIGELPAVPAIIFQGLLVLAGVVLLFDGIFGAAEM